MITKTEKQDQIVELWTTGEKRRGIFQACPRFGKTRVGIKVIEEQLLLKPDSSFIIVVPSDIIRQRWIQEAKDYTGLPEAIELISKHIYTSSSLLNLTEIPKVDLLILDEIHRYFSIGTRKVSRYIQQIKFTNFLGLTGVDVKTSIPGGIIRYFGGILNIISEEEALQNGWISKFIEYNIPLELSDVDKEKYKLFSKPITETLDNFKGMANRLNNFTKSKMFKDDFQVIYACHTGLKYRAGIKSVYIEGYKIRQTVAYVMGWNKNLNIDNPHSKMIIDHWNPDTIYERTKAFKQFVKSRNDILVHNRIKIEAVLKILELNPVPTIIFNDSTEMVDEITDAIKTKVIAYHSNIESRPLFDERSNDYIRIATGKNKGQPKLFGKVSLKKQAIEGMLIGRYKYLVTAKALDEGLDIENIHQVITTSGSTNPIQHFQRVSRGKTIDRNDDNKVTMIFNLYFKSFYNDLAERVTSRDEYKLSLRQRALAYTPIELKNIDEISHLFT